MDAQRSLKKAALNTNSQQWAGTARWLQHRTRDWKVAGLSPCRRGGIIFFSGVNFLSWVLFRYPFHPCVTAVACKRSWWLCQKCRWQVTAKHACHFAWSDMAHGCMVSKKQTEMAAVSCGTSHVSAISIPLRWIFKKTRYKKLVTHVESHASAVSLLESGE